MRAAIAKAVSIGNMTARPNCAGRLAKRVETSFPDNGQAKLAKVCLTISFGQIS